MSICLSGSPANISCKVDASKIQNSLLDSNKSESVWAVPIRRCFDDPPGDSPCAISHRVSFFVVLPANQALAYDHRVAASAMMASRNAFGSDTTLRTLCGKYEERVTGQTLTLWTACERSPRRLLRPFSSVSSSSLLAIDLCRWPPPDAIPNTARQDRGFRAGLKLRTSNHGLK